MWSHCFRRLTCFIGVISSPLKSFSTHQCLMGESSYIQLKRTWEIIWAGDRQIVSRYSGFNRGTFYFTSLFIIVVIIIIIIIIIIINNNIIIIIIKSWWWWWWWYNDDNNTIFVLIVDVISCNFTNLIDCRCRLLPFMTSSLRTINKGKSLGQILILRYFHLRTT